MVLGSSEARPRKRTRQALIDHPDHQVKRLGHNLMRLVKWMFQHWRSYKPDTTDWPTFRELMSPIRAEVNGLLQWGAFSGNRRLVGMCQELHNHREWLWTFVDHEGIEPTNNTAERALRPAVIYRKRSFGIQSESGSRFLERLLTVSETRRLQNRSIYGYLITAVQAHFKQQPIPCETRCWEPSDVQMRSRERLAYVPAASPRYPFVTVSSMLRITLASMLQAASSSATSDSLRTDSPTDSSFRAAALSARNRACC